MTQQDYTTRVLVADEGHMLTQAADVPAFRRELTRKVYLSPTDDPANWREVTAEEAAALQAEIDEANAALTKEAESQCN